MITLSTVLGHAAGLATAVLNPGTDVKMTEQLAHQLEPTTLVCLLQGVKHDQFVTSRISRSPLTLSLRQSSLFGSKTTTEAQARLPFVAAFIEECREGAFTSSRERFKRNSPPNVDWIVGSTTLPSQRIPNIFSIGEEIRKRDNAFIGPYYDEFTRLSTGVVSTGP